MNHLGTIVEYIKVRKMKPEIGQFKCGRRSYCEFNLFIVGGILVFYKKFSHLINKMIYFNMSIVKKFLFDCEEIFSIKNTNNNKSYIYS